MRRNTTTLTAGLAFLAVVLAGCGTTSGTSDDTAPTDDTGMSETVTPEEEMPATDDMALDAERVVLAVVLLTAGDIDAALAEGLVSPAEVDAASRAITAGTVQDWIDLAAEQLAAG